MAAISEIVDVTITANTRTVTQEGFNVPLLWSRHARFPEAYRVYAETSDMLADGFTENDPAYKMALALCSQDDRPATFVVGKATSGYTWGGELVITSAVEGAHVKFRIIGSTGLDAEIDYTILAAATTTSVATAVEALIEALAGVASAPSVATIAITADAADTMFWIVPAEGEVALLNCAYRDTTADANYGAQIAAFDLVYGDFYGVISELRSSANTADMSAAIEAMTKIHIAGSSDTREEDAGTRVTGAALLAGGYERTALLFSRFGHMYADAAWMGSRLALAPGSATWKFAKLNGVTVDSLTTTKRTALSDVNTNTFETIGGLNVVREGKMGAGEFIDITITIDWLTARIQERVFGVLANARKVPYTEKGSALIVGEVLAQLREGEDENVQALVPDTSFVRAPSIASRSSAQRAAREFGPIQFGADLAGAIHKVSLRGNLVV